MAFYLIADKTTKRSFDILTEEEWSQCHILNDLFIEIAHGDEATLKKMKEQLGGTPYIRNFVNEASTPLMKVTRVVAVTSSGNTKFSVSPTVTDPYKTDSDTDFFPGVEAETSSSDENSVDFARFKNIKRRINFGSTKVISETSSFANQDDESASQLNSSLSTNSSVVTGEVTISNEEITIDVSHTTHHSTFSVPLTKHCTTKLRHSIFKGVLPLQEKEANHKCVSVHPRKPIGYVLLTPDKDCLTVNLECCIKKGSAVGTFIFIKETNLYTTVLKYCDPFEDESEESPVQQINKPLVKMKTHYCLFCKQLKTCIGRHYKIKHINEPRVKEIVEEEVPTKAVALMKKLRLEGDSIYNRSVPLYDRISVRKPSLQMVSNSVHCPTCSGLIAARNFCRHERKCANRAPDGKRRLRHMQREERMQQINLNDDDRTFFSIINNMTKDNYREIIENDPLAKSLAVYLVKSQPKTHNFNNVRQQLRRLARLFDEVKKRVDVNEIKDMFVPSMYSTVVAAIRDVCSFNEPDEKRKSQLALSYGPLISSLIKRLQIQLLKSDIEDPEKMQSLKNLENIHEQEFKVEITRQALMSAKHKKMATKSELPSTADIEKLMNFTRKLGEELYDRLQIAFDFNSWIDLGKCLLCQLLVFNRRRVGEMSRARVNDFQNRRQVTHEYFQTLNRLEIILAEEFSVFTIMAKRTRPVNLLITKSQVKQLEFFISLRAQAGVPEDNTFLFATPTHTDGYLKASEVLRSFANQCGAANPSLLKSTNLRKHIATMSQMFCLNDNEMKQLADFLGHDRDVHEKFYRLNESNTQITKLSKFLATVGDKNVFEYRGRSIDDLPFDAHNDEMFDEVSECSNLEEEENEEVQKRVQIAEQMEESLPSTSTAGRKRKSQSKSYGLRQRSALKVPAKLRTPIKNVPQSSSTKSPAKSPFTTQQLLNMVTVPQRKPVKKLRWTPAEKAIIEAEFGDNLRNKTLPSLSRCEEVKRRNLSVLGQRDVHSIYCLIRNTISKK